MMGPDLLTQTRIMLNGACERHVKSRCRRRVCLRVLLLNGLRSMLERTTTRERERERERERD